MSERETVIREAERIMCSTVDRDMIDSFCEDVIDLLKERGAVEPIPYHRSDGTIFKYECRQCRTKIFKMDLFCRHCGQAVKWNG